MEMASVDSSRRNRQPRLLTTSERERLEEFIDNISYSARYVANAHLNALMLSPRLAGTRTMNMSTGTCNFRNQC